MKNIKNIIIIILLAIITASLVYIYMLVSENNIYKDSVETEKVILQEELEITLKDLNTNQEQNISITKDFNQANEKLKGIRNELVKSKKRIQQLKKELNNSEENSLSKIQELRSVLDNVKSNNQFLFKSLDSIKTLNDSLMMTIAITKSELNSEKLQSKELSLKLSDATKVQISNVEVYAVEEKKSGEIKATTRYKKADGIQIKYNILNNKALTNTECDIFYVLKDSKGLILSANGVFVYNGVNTKFTDGTRLVLNGETMPINDIISLNDIKLTKGEYTLEFYSEDSLLAKESFILKKGFLGVF